MLSLNLLISQCRRKVKARNAEDHSSLAPSSPRLPIPSWWRKLWQGEHRDNKNFCPIELFFWVRLIWAQSSPYNVWQNQVTTGLSWSSPKCARSLSYFLDLQVTHPDWGILFMRPSIPSTLSPECLEGIFKLIRMVLLILILWRRKKHFRSKLTFYWSLMKMMMTIWQAKSFGLKVQALYLRMARCCHNQKHTLLIYGWVQQERWI